MYFNDVKHHLWLRLKLIICFKIKGIEISIAFQLDSWIKYPPSFAYRNPIDPEEFPAQHISLLISSDGISCNKPRTHIIELIKKHVAFLFLSYIFFLLQFIACKMLIYRKMHKLWLRSECSHTNT